jgi:hypothetical protein
MGLLEKAYTYKKKINESGKETLIDRIQGPAETDFVQVEVTPIDDDNDIELNVYEPDSELKLSSFEEELRESKKTDLSAEQEPEAPAIETESSQAGDDSGIAVDELDGLITEEKTPGIRGGGLEIADDDEMFSLPSEEKKSAKDTIEPQNSSTDGIAAVKDEKAQVISESAVEPREIRKITGDEPEPFGPDDAPVINKAAMVELPAEKASVTTDSDVKNDSSMALPDRNAETIKETVEKGEEAKETETPEKVSGSAYEKRNKKFHDFLVLYEIEKDIMRAGTKAELHDVVLFSIMGQIGASSASIIMADTLDYSNWMVAESRGVTIRNKNMVFNSTKGIVAELLARKDIIDLDDFKTSPVHLEDYYKFENNFTSNA